MFGRNSILASAIGFLIAIGAAPQAQARDYINFDTDHDPGTILIVNADRHLYYVLGEGRAIRYNIAVGKPSEQWTGEYFVTRMRENPGWGPTASMRRRNPSLPRYVAPGPNNPLGVRAIYLGWSLYRIHGTNAPNSIGRAASSGCFRMLNEDVSHLYEHVHIGTPVLVVESLEDSAQQVADQSD
jgi:lipoprotein-anchoring transpeptidase ErfK/SrfK